LSCCRPLEEMLLVLYGVFSEISLSQFTAQLEDGLGRITLPSLGVDRREDCVKSLPFFLLLALELLAERLRLRLLAVSMIEVVSTVASAAD